MIRRAVTGDTDAHVRPSTRITLERAPSSAKGRRRCSSDAGRTVGARRLAPSSAVVSPRPWRARIDDLRQRRQLNKKLTRMNATRHPIWPFGGCWRTLSTTPCIKPPKALAMFTSTAICRRTDTSARDASRALTARRQRDAAPHEMVALEDLRSGTIGCSRSGHDAITPFRRVTTK